MATSNDEFRIPKLTSENYHVWSIRAKALLIQKGYWEAIEPGFNQPMKPEEEKVNNKALTFLLLVVEDDIIDDICDCKKAREAWFILEDMNSKHGLLQILQLMRDFFNVKMKKNESIKNYLSHIIELHRKLMVGGYGFTDREVALVMLMGLPETYEPLILNLEQNEEVLTMKLVKTKLLVEEKRKTRREMEKENKDEDGPRALITKEKYSRPHSNKKYEASKEGKSRVYRSPERRRVICYCCGKAGHIARNCPSDLQKTSKKDTDDNDKNKTTMQTHRVMCAKKNITNNSANYWYLDCAATDHMTSSKNKLINFKNNETEVIAANGTTMNVTGKGDALLDLCERDGGHGIKLVDTLYVPELDGNLLSIGRIDEAGFNLHISRGKATVTDTEGTVMFTAIRKERLYKIEESKLTAKMTRVEDNNLWHRRLGHLHFDAINQLRRQNISVKMQFNNKHDSCDVCIKGKMRKKSFPITEAIRSTKPLELIHSDVVGKITPTSKGGSNYYVTFIDDYTRHVTVYPMKRKSEVLEKFNEYRKMAETFHNTKVNTLRSDNGGEYKSTEFDKYLKDNGIRRQLTVPDTPQQNGVAERMNETLMDMTRCLLIESGIPKYMWADAIIAACHIRNKCPSKAIGGKILETLWTGKDVTLDHLKVYGCKTWMSNRKRRDKLDSKAIECIFIGYPDGVKGYKLWNKEDDTFHVSRDVTFDENAFPFKDNETVFDNIDKSHSGDVIINLYEEIQQADEIQQSNNEMLEQSGRMIPPHVDETVQQPQEIQSSPNDETVSSIDDDEEKINNLMQNEVQQPDSATELTQAGEEVPLRRSKRLATKQPGQPRCYSCNIIRQEKSSADPTTVEEALSSQDKKQWKAAMQEEFNNLKRNETWILVPRPEKERIVKCRWIFKKKYDGNGNLEKYKARLVARGFTQVYGIDYKDTYSPVVKTKSIRTLLALAVERRWEVHQLDVTAAYLNGILKETIYMEQPTSFEEKAKEENVCLLKKSLYGLHQSGREWNLCLDEFLKSCKLTRSKTDPCVYFDINNELIIGVYVDDFLITSRHEKTIENFKKQIKRKFDVKDIGRASFILSMKIDWNENGSLTLNQSEYAEELLRTMGMENCRGASTPLDPGTRYMKTAADTKIDNVLHHRYRQVIGGLLYLAGGTRPDLAYATAYMSQFNERPSAEHWMGVKHILRYVKQTTKWGLTFKRTGQNIEIFCDSDWASDKIDRRSFSGYVVKMAGTATSWSSKKQQTTAQSTVEAEYLSMCYAAKEVMWLRNFLGEIGAGSFSPSPQVVRVDNQGAITLTKNYVTSERNKHIDIRYFFLREKVSANQLIFEYVPTTDNAADLLTKPLSGKKTKEHCRTLGLLNMTEKDDIVEGKC